MISIKGLHKSFGSQGVLNGVDLDIPFGDRIIMSGQNGAGKTTLIRCILGEYMADNGSVSIFGNDPVKNRVSCLNHVAFVPQMPPPLKLTVKVLIDYSSEISGFDKKKVEEYANALDLDINANIGKSFHKLSGGMKQKLLISIALARNADITIFDEPTANLDLTGRKIFHQLLEAIVGQKTFIFISHRIEEVSNLVNRYAELDMGRIVKDEKI